MNSRTIQVTEGWLPIPEDMARELGWSDGALVDIEVIDGTVIATRHEPEPHPTDCLCDGCVCGGCGERNHKGRCRRR